MAKKRICKECGADLPQSKGIKSFACRTLNLCEYCYEIKIGFERKPETGIVIEGEDVDYEEYDESPYGWIDQFHGSMR